MNSILKLVVLFTVLVVVIFGVTYIATYSPQVVQDDKATTPEKNEDLKPLVFRSGVLEWDPHSETEPANRTFPGCFEPGAQHTARFWFSNPHPSPVTMQLAYISCSACSEGGVVAVPPELLQTRLDVTATGLLPFGTFPAAGLSRALADAVFETKLQALPWTRKKFKDHPQATFEVPAAPPGGEQWGILELHFTARPPIEPRTLKSSFIAWTAEKPQSVETFKFEIHFAVVAPFEVNPTKIDAGEIGENSAPRKYPILIVSATRTPEEFQPPFVDVRNSTHGPVGPGDLVTVDPPKPLKPEEIEALTTDPATGRQQRRILSAYRSTVTVAPPAGDQSLDIGSVERIVAVTPAKEGDEKTISVKATIMGDVRLGGGAAMDMGSFKSSEGRTKAFTLDSDSPAIVLELDKELTSPPYLDVQVEKKPPEGDSGVFRVTVTLPANQVFGPLPSSSVVVFKIAGEKPRRVRIPITGNGVLN